MDLFFSQSDDVVIPLIVEWLDFIDVARFDKACAFSRREKENLQRVYSTKQVVFCNNVKKFVNRGGNLRWLLHSKIKVAELVVTSQMVADPTLVESYFELCGHTIGSLSITKYNSKIISSAMNNCPNIKLLSIDLGSADAHVNLFSESVETFHLTSGFGAISLCIKTKFPNMRDLTVEGFGVSDWIFMCILQNTDNLQSLTLDGAHSLKDRAIDCIGPFNPSLRSLSVNDMAFSAKYLASILASTPQLKELSLCHNHGQLSARKLFDTLAAHCPNLTALTIGESDRAFSSSLLQAFGQMLTCCVHLRVLSMSCCEFVIDEVLLSIASNAKRMERLDIFDCNVSNVGLAGVAENCIELKHISFCVGSGYSTSEDSKLLFRNETTVDVTHLDAGFAEGNEFGSEEEYSNGDEASDGEEEGGDWDF